MTKTVATYWNPLLKSSVSLWKKIDGTNGMLEELTLSIDLETEEYTRLTKFLPGADTRSFGGKSHAYPEEIFIIEGKLYDHAFQMWLEKGHYASRVPGEIHGPFTTDTGCIVLEISFPQRFPKIG